MNRLLALAAFVLVSSAAFVHAQPAAPTAPPPAAAPAAAQKADVAAPKVDKTGKPQEKFIKMHEDFIARAKKGDVEILFVGDSITAGWAGNGKDVWAERYAPKNAANFGIGGDRTQHVLWRMENGELEGIKPKVAVLMIGTNNSKSDPADDIASGVEKIVKTIRDKTGAKVLLLAVFPRGATPEAAADQRATLAKVNARIAKLDDGQNVRFLDIGDKFMEPDKSISKEIMPDALHLSPKGYTIWADAIDPELAKMTAAK